MKSQLEKLKAMFIIFIACSCLLLILATPANAQLDDDDEGVNSGIVEGIDGTLNSIGSDVKDFLNGDDESEQKPQKKNSPKVKPEDDEKKGSFDKAMDENIEGIKKFFKGS